MKNDAIQIEFLPDGTVKSSNDAISQANHSSADAFFRILAQLMGGTVTRTKRGHGHQHTHEHEYAKEHN